MAIDTQNLSIKELEILQKKAAKDLKKLDAEIAHKKTASEQRSKLFSLISNDHKRHKNDDDSNAFRGVADYLECYIRGIAPIARSNLFARFGITGRRGKVTPEAVQQIKNDLGLGKTLQVSADSAGVSIATAMKVKKGEYDNPQS